MPQILELRAIDGGLWARLDMDGKESPITVWSPDEVRAARQAALKEAMEIISEMRMSEAGIFDAEHSGQRGEDRRNALYDAYHAVRRALEQGAT